MNHYGKWWNTTITLYNRVEDENGKIKWYRHIIDECFYTHKLENIIKNNTLITSNISVCRIKASEYFVPKSIYDNLSDSERNECFTLCSGDIIVPEETDFVIDEYTPHSRSSTLLSEYKKYPGCFTISIVNINTGEGRGNEHYYTMG